ncbi:hypothetical protein BD410DRAFT_728104 [Rickenella mellea]|uniref:Uncharacterized protein n=1 Tax=Rickenella mellea TaxID=50990 RepID=A0A4Y7PVX8_9AGAM|nr:hypothetical protein BD410DRAFT_728104 [Rickenella mellea]
MVGGSGVASGPSSPEVKTPASPPRSPRTQRTLRFAHIADLFVKLRRLQNNARQANDLESTSGPEPVTHAELKDDSSVKKHARLELEEVFMCANGVDVVKLLRASRGTLLDAAKLLRSNVLVDETWSCIICRPKSRPDGPYKVYVTYGAFVASCSKQDPHRPVSTQEARGVPGLMTILNRESICLKAEPFPPKPT